MRLIVATVLAIVGVSSMAAAEDQVMTVRNIQTVKSWNDTFNRGDIEAAAAYFSEDTRNFGRQVGREGLRRVLEDIHQTFPDWKTEIVDTVAVADSVIIRCKVSATHLGVGKLPINGGLLVGVPPTGKRFEVQHIHWFKLRDGRIADHYATRDDIGMMQQLGLLPSVPRPDTRPLEASKK